MVMAVLFLVFMAAGSYHIRPVLALLPSHLFLLAGLNRPLIVWSMRILIWQLLRKYKYPPEGCEDAIALVLQQAEALAEE